MDWLPINWRLLKHPTNWLIVALMTIIGVIMLEVVAQWYSANVAPKFPGPFKPVTGSPPGPAAIAAI